MNEILNEIKTLCELEMSIINNGKIEGDGERYFAHIRETERLKELSKLQDKYHYGWYIAKESLEEQLKSINQFKMFIMNIQ